jgi:predicted ester cyclase
MPVDVARAVFEAAGRRDPDGIVELGAADYVDDFVAVGEFRGRDAIREFFRETFAAFPDFQMSVEAIVADDGSAVVQWHLSGTFSGGPFPGRPLDGTRVVLRGVDVMEIAGWLIRRNTVSYDGRVLPGRSASCRRRARERTGHWLLRSMQRRGSAGAGESRVGVTPAVDGTRAVPATRPQLT